MGFSLFASIGLIPFLLFLKHIFGVPHARPGGFVAACSVQAKSQQKGACPARTCGLNLPCYRDISRLITIHTDETYIQFFAHADTQHIISVHAVHHIHIHLHGCLTDSYVPPVLIPIKSLGFILVKKIHHMNLFVKHFFLKHPSKMFVVI